MRMFLPIKGPGGRYLTPREKVALLILGVTLILCALTLLAGDGAYAADGTRNPVSAFVALLCRTFGGGIIALYALVLVWSGLIYFKGERVVDMRPLAGRFFAALCVTLGISGVLGIAHLETAGSLGLTVGAAIGNTFGATLGFPILIVLMLLGVHLAGQGAWSAMREPVRATATTAAPGGLGFGLKDAPQGRFAHPPLPDDGDPSADERTLAITKAMEEIERSKGVTIVDVQADEEEEEEEQEADDRPSIGEEVDEFADIDDETEEADVRRGVAAVEEALAGGTATEHIADDEDEQFEDEVADEAADEVADEVADEEEDEEEEADYGSDRHGFIPVPPEVAAAPEIPEDDECIEAVFVGDREEEDDETDEEDDLAYTDEADEADDYDDEEYEEADEEDDDDEEALADEVDDVEMYEDEDEDDDDEVDDDETAYDEEYEDEEAEADEDEEYDEEEEEDEDEIAEADDEAEYDDADVDEDEEEESDSEWVQAEFDEPTEAPVAAAEPESEPDEEESYESVVAGQADGAGSEEEEEDEDDPYAQGGLLRRLKHGAAAGEGLDDEDRPYTAFDWRGRPLE